nr:TonB-dependent receptor [Gemmatimonadaceae bacterium]
FENLFVVDNIEVPNINHFGTQGSTGGPISLINIDFVQDASLSAGGFGVRYGDKTSSVTTIALREGTRERVSSELNLSATGAGLILEGPLPGGGSFLSSVRRSYLDLIFEAAGFGFIPSYTDLTLKTVWRPSARDQISFLTIGAIARVTFNNTTADNRFENSRVAAPSQDQYFSGLTWRRTLRNGLLTTTLGRTWTRFTTVQRDSGSATAPPQPVFIANTTEGETSLRSDLSMTRGGFEFDAGNILKVASALDYRLLIPGQLRRDAAGVPRGLDTDTSFTGTRNATYLQGTWRLTDRLRATVGARGDYYAFLDNALRVAPRASLTFTVDEATTASLAGGRYWQAPQLIWLVGDPSNRALRPFRADQVVASIARTVRPDLKLQVEAYAKRYGDFPARVFRPAAVLQPAGFDDVTNDIPFGLEPLASVATGTVVGAEALLQKKLSDVPLYGLLSLSYNRTRFEGLTGRTVVGAFDTPVILNALVGWRPNAKWELSTRARSATGLPTTPFVTSGANAGQLDFTRYNDGDRLPTFFSLDVRVDRRFTIGRSQLITYLDVQNATGRRNVSQITWNPRLRATEQNESIGVLPSIGINWEF